jgi:hypothetical protein
MRAAVKNMNGDFIHSITPRKARLLLKDKKAAIESNSPFTIRLLFSESECGLKDSKSLNEFNSDFYKPEKDNTMCEHKSYKYNSKTHIIFGAAGSGKTTMFQQLIQEKLNRDEDVFVFGTPVYGRMYFNDKSNSKIHFISPKDVSIFSNKVDPKNLAEYIVNFYYSVAGNDITRTIAIDGLEQFELNPDYTVPEYFRELAKECKSNDINFLYVLRPSTLDKNETAYYKLPEIYERFSDIITVLK